MALENWCFKLRETPNQTNAFNYQRVYKEMKALVMSLVSSTRALPAFKLARNQSQDDTYTVTSKVGVEEPDVKLLGSERVFKSIGSVETPLGLVSVSLSYRKRSHMFMSPQSSRVLTDTIRDDHFEINAPARTPTHVTERMSARLFSFFRAHLCCLIITLLNSTQPPC